MFKKMIALVLLCLIIVPAALHARQKDLVDKKIMEAWKGITTPPGNWMVGITPPMPHTWPADKEGVMDYYAYAQSPVQADAARVSAPWAKVALGKDGTTRLDILTEKIKEIGVQGVKPVDDQETMALFRRAEIFEIVLMQLMAASPVNERNVSDMKKYYCAWSSLNGVIAAKVKPLYPAFFTWLGCGK